jgi:hypothetical protein
MIIKTDDQIMIINLLNIKNMADGEDPFPFLHLILRRVTTPYSCAKEGNLAQLIVYHESGTNLFEPRKDDGKNCLQIAEESLVYEKEHGICQGRVDDLEECVKYLRGLLVPTKSAMKR